MIDQNVNATLSDADIKAIKDAIQAIHAKLPFLSGLTPEKRQQLVKLGPKSYTFAFQALDAAEDNLELMPRFLDIEAARQDLELYESLNSILQNLSQLYKLIEDTQMIAGSEAYAAARKAYSSLKTNGKGIGLDDVIDNLSQRFQPRPRREPAA